MTTFISGNYRRFCLITTIVLLLFPWKATASVAIYEPDSLNLVALYNSLNGANWTNGWTLLNEANTWYGITLNSSGEVTEINLSNNNLSGSIPTFASVDLQQLTRLDLSQNSLSGSIPSEFCGLSSLTELLLNDCNIDGDIPPCFINLTSLSTLAIDGNKFSFENLETLIGHPILVTQSNFTYAPQNPDTIPSDSLIIFYQESNTLNIASDGVHTQYSWQHVSSISNSNSIGNGLNYTLMVDSYYDAGIYQAELTNSYFPNLTLYSQEHHVWTSGVDTRDAEFEPDEIIFDFGETLTSANIEELKELIIQFNATVVDSFLCNTYLNIDSTFERLQVWEIANWPVDIQDYSIPGTNSPNWTFDINEIRKRARENIDGGVKEMEGFNYFTAQKSISSPDDFSSSDFPRMKKEKAPSLSNQATSVIAIIDTGIKDTLNFTTNNSDYSLWYNDDYNSTEENCLIDEWGWDFVNDNQITDIGANYNIHATEMVAYMLDNKAPAANFEFMNIKTAGDDGRGNLFDAICGIHYARTQDADIVNMSWSYQGDSSAVLHRALLEASEERIILVTSAGNGVEVEGNFEGKEIGMGIDQLPIFPAAYSGISNLITVATSNSDGSALASYSNFSDTHVQLAAPGTGVTHPWGGKFGSGTSYSAAFVSAMIANYLSKFPMDTPEQIPGQIIDSIKSNIIPMAAAPLEWGGRLDQLSAVIETCPATCTNDQANTDGKARIGLVEGGFGNYMYDWDNGATGIDTCNLSVGMHTVTITDLVGLEYVQDFYIYDDCECEPTRILSNLLITSTDYEVMNTITSTQVLDSEIIVDYDAGDCVELLPGFEVQLGASLSVIIDGCNGGEGGSIIPSSQNCGMARGVNFSSLNDEMEKNPIIEKNKPKN